MPMTQGKMLRLNSPSIPEDKTAFASVIPSFPNLSKKAGNLRERLRKRRGFKFLPGQAFGI